MAAPVCILSRSAPRHSGRVFGLCSPTQRKNRTMTNQPLLELYKRHESTIYEIGLRCAENMQGPFLIAPNEGYWRSMPKIAFVGQETNGWSSERGISEQMTAYSKFNLGEAYYSSPFWNVIRKLERALTGGNYWSAWLNFNRYDEGGGRPSWDNQRVLSELDFLFLEELKLLAPDVVIFFTGPDYDERLTSLFQATQLPITGFPTRQLCGIQTSILRGLIFRTYHPIYLRRSGLEEKVIDAIRAEVTQKRSTEAEPGAAPNGGPATRLGNSGVSEGPPSVS